MPLDPKQQPPYYTPATQANNPQPKEYIGYLTQSGTDAPTIEIVKNTYLNSLIWSYDTTGSYLLTSASGELIYEKTIINFNTPTTLFTDSVTIQGAAQATNDNTVINIVTYVVNETTDTITRQNERLIRTPITITTYP